MRALLGLVALAGAVTLGIGALHAPGATPALRWLAGGACPVGGAVSADAREAARVHALRPTLAAEAARTREVYGLPLGAPRATVDAWRTATGAACHARADALTCAGGSWGPGEVALAFDPTGRLVSVDVHEIHADPEAAAAQVNARAEALAASAGPPSAESGHPTGSFLAGAPLRQVARTFAFSDYRVSLTATHARAGHYVVREVHQVL